MFLSHISGWGFLELMNMDLQEVEEWVESATKLYIKMNKVED